MIDSMTHSPIEVSGKGDLGRYIIVPLDQLDAVETVFRVNRIEYWVDSHSISVSGKPKVIFVTLARGSDAEQVQRFLDAAN